MTLKKLILNCIDRNGDAAFTARSMVLKGIRLDATLKALDKMTDKDLSGAEALSVKAALVEVQGDLDQIAEAAFVIIKKASAAREAIASKRLDEVNF